VVGTAEAALGTQTESPTREWYHLARILRTLGGTRGGQSWDLASFGWLVGDPEFVADDEWEVLFREVIRHSRVTLAEVSQ
jgi:hypothetical protein